MKISNLVFCSLLVALVDSFLFLDDSSRFFRIGSKKSQRVKAQKVNKRKMAVYAELFRKRIGYILYEEKPETVDLVFLVDGSSSVGADNFESELQFIRKLFLSFTYSHESIKVAIITFASIGNVVRVVDQISAPSSDDNPCDVHSKDVLYSGGGTYTKGALIEAKNVLFKNNSTGLQVIFLISDGFSNGGDPKPVAKLLKGKGVIIFSMGIQTGNTAELRDIASSPAEHHLYVLNSFHDFEYFVTQALHKDLNNAMYKVVNNTNRCEDKCISPAYCACSLSKGEYVCLCPPGYHPVGGSSCQACASGSYSSGVNSDCVKCPDPHHITQVPATNITDCTCRHGYEADKFSCKPPQCPMLSPPENGMFVRDKCSSVVNAGCGVRCNIGFTLTGSSVRLCQKNGQWSGEPPKCTVNKCKLLHPPKSGSMHCNSEKDDSGGLPVDTLCNITCNDGYQLIGSKQRICLPVAKWDGIPTKCKLIQCDKLLEIENGYYEPPQCSEDRKLPTGLVCTSNCREGYELEGPTSRTCTSQGVWSDNGLNVCNDIQAPNLTCPSDITLTAKYKELTPVEWDEPDVVDNSEEPVTVWTQPIIQKPLMLPVGAQTIIYVAMDNSLNQAVCNFTITIEGEGNLTSVLSVNYILSVPIDELVPLIENCDEDKVLYVNKMELEKLQGNLSVALEEIYEKGLETSTKIDVPAVDSSGVRCIIGIVLKDDLCRNRTLSNDSGSLNCTEEGNTLVCRVSCKPGFSIPSKNMSENSEIVCGGASSLQILPYCEKETEATETIEKIVETIETVVNCSSSQLYSSFAGKVKESCKDCTIEDYHCDESDGKAVVRARRYPRKEMTLRGRRKRSVITATIVKTFLKCSDGKILSGNKCLDCSPGWYFNSTQDDCIICPEDSFQPLSGQTSCLPCPTGKRVAERPAIRADFCKSLCPPGTHGLTGQFFPCLLCPLGTFSSEPGASKCDLCPNSMTKSTEGSTQIEQCQPKVDMCANSPCQNNGTCLMQQNFVSCICPKGFGGSLCEIPISPCLKRPCLNSGRCSISHGGTSYSCSCAPQFSGANCQNDVNECQSNPCLNNGTCLNTMGHFKCLCDPKYQGDICEERVNICEESPCANGSTCQMNDAGYTCLCAQGWFGKQCEYDPCFSSPCRHGICLLSGAGYVCYCDAGYHGPHCELKFNPCAFKPCFHNGTCLPADKGGFMCDCQDGYFGRNCERKPSDLSLKFPAMSLSNYAQISVKWNGVSRITMCTFLRAHKSSNSFGTLFSFATPKQDNMFTLTFNNGLYIYLNGEFAVSQVSIKSGQWRHLCVLWDNSGKWGVFVDGSLKESDTDLSPNATIEGEGAVVIGQEQDQIGGGFNLFESFVGEISQLNVWNRTLPSDEILQMVSSCSEEKSGDLLQWKEVLKRKQGSVQTSSAPVCQSCREPPVSDYSAVELISNRTAEYTCDKGYKLANTNRSTLNCLRSGEWEKPTPLCQPVSCNFPGYFPQGVITAKAYTYPNKVYYSCSPPLKLVGPAIRQCQENGTWSGFLPSCQVPGDCPDIQVPQFASLWFKNNTAHLECRTGYLIEGASELHCKNGVWDNPVPICHKKECPPIHRKPNSILKLGNLKAEIKCEDGYQMWANNQFHQTIDLYCSDDLQWSNAQENLTENWECLTLNRKCTAPQATKEANFNVTKTSFDTGETIEVICPKGFEVVDNITCQNGSWSNVNATLCKKIVCGQPNETIPSGKIHIFKGVEYGNVAVVQCAEGYQGFGNLALRCQENKQWTRFQGTCKRVSCGKPQIPGGGIVTGNSFLFMDVVQISCPNGKKLNGESKIMCNKDGKWDSSPSCVNE